MTVRIGLVGIGGFAGAYISQLEKELAEGRVSLDAVVVRSPEKYPEAMQRLPASARIHRDFYDLIDAEQEDLDVLLIPTGISTHKEFSIAAMEAGFNVGVEKPPAGTVEEVIAMAEASERTGRFCGIGFQNVCSPTFRNLKNFVVSGGLGEIMTIKHIGLWRRLDSYYGRNTWAGKIEFDGYWILDGPLNNPLSHQLNNALFLASSDPLAPAQPRRVRAEFYRAHAGIEGEDTDCVEVELANGVRVLFYATLCAAVQDEPLIRVEGTAGTATYRPRGEVSAVDANGVDLEVPDTSEGQDGFVHNVIEHCRGNAPLYCPAAYTIPFAKVMNGAYESAGRIAVVDEEHIVRTPAEDSVETCIKNIAEDARRCFDAGELYSQAGLPWALPSPNIFFELEGYDHFSGTFEIGA